MYVLEQAIEDVEVQKKGFVLVYYDFVYDRQEEASFIMSALRLRTSFPWRLAGIHYCSSNPDASNAGINAVITFLRVSSNLWNLSTSIPPLAVALGAKSTGIPNVISE